MTTVERLLATAHGELGYLEKASNAQLDSKAANAGHANYTKYARDLDKLGVYHAKKNGFAWCDMFVDWCFIQTFGLETAMKMTCQPMGGYGAGCTASAQYYKKAGRFFKTGPQPGDQIFFSKDGGANMYHTGLVQKVENNRVYTSEGNTSSEAGVVENGGAVREKSYSISYNKIAGYGRPDYSLAPMEEEENEVRYNTVAECPSWAQKTIQKLVNKGFLSGDGKGLDLSHDMVRLLVIQDRAGVFGKG